MERYLKMEIGIMLVLSRKCQEAVVIIGSDGIGLLLKVRVLSIKNGKVSLGFEAASDIPVHREEVWKRIRSDTVINGKIQTRDS